MARQGLRRGKGVEHATLRHACLRRSLCDAAQMVHASYSLALKPLPPTFGVPVQMFGDGLVSARWAEGNDRQVE